ncbi:MAG TPA: AAA family ATPase, partial [Thermoanaerobaculia bacterium]|nr:AAA family ATPase [Thermoanaerobaculia bacterium]
MPSSPGSGRSRHPLGEGGLAAHLDELVPRLLERQPRALGRAVSLVEDGGPGQRELVRRLYSKTGRARVVGLTGPPGAGKSTLVDRLARLIRKRGETVGILAVDPTSPYTGGALLGDRIRMQTLYTDPGVFIRSMATRGTMGGLARATRDAVDLLDAAGF